MANLALTAKLSHSAAIYITEQGSRQAHSDDHSGASKGRRTIAIDGAVPFANQALLKAGLPLHPLDGAAAPQAGASHPPHVPSARRIA